MEITIQWGHVDPDTGDDIEYEVTVEWDYGTIRSAVRCDTGEDILPRLEADKAEMARMEEAADAEVESLLREAEHDRADYLEDRAYHLGDW